MRLLLVAYYFPPLGGAGSRRALSFATALPDLGWDVTVLAPRTGAYHVDRALEFDEDQVVRTSSLELSSLGRRALQVAPSDGTGATAAALSGWQHRARRLAHATVYFPDPQIGWFAPALAQGRRLLRRQRFDAVLSTSFPVTAHLVGRSLARAANVPWVADFRDPWSRWLVFQGRGAGAASAVERRLARAADRVIMTTPSWAQAHARLWGREVDVVPNGHDLAPRGEEPPIEPKVLTYVGTFYPEFQDLEPVWNALVALPDWRLRIVGTAEPSMTAALRARDLWDRVHVTGYVSGHEAARLARTSDALLLAGPQDPTGLMEGQIPAKTYEYLATDRPIIFVGRPDSDAGRLIAADPGGFVVPDGDAAIAGATLARVSGMRFHRDPSVTSRQRGARDLARLLDELTPPRGGETTPGSAASTARDRDSPRRAGARRPSR